MKRTTTNNRLRTQMRALICRTNDLACEREEARERRLSSIPEPKPALPSLRMADTSSASRARAAEAEWVRGFSKN